jgi:Fe-S-cluster containining protein
MASQIEAIEAMHPECAACGGRCCKAFLLVNLKNKREADWFNTRLGDEAVVTQSEGCGPHSVFIKPCGKLKENGECGIYKDRPQMCKDLQVGSVVCKVCKSLPI